MKAFQEADLLVTVGSRNEEFQTGAWRIFPPRAQLVQIDISPFEIGRNWLPNVAIVGDAKLVLAALLDALPTTARPQWSTRCAEWGRAKQAYEALVAAECMRDELPLKSKRIVYELNQVFGRDTILVHENGSQDLWSYYSPYYRVLDLDGVVAPGEQTCMGAGVTGAVGAKLARPDRKVVCVTGDGAFQMLGQDVPTARQYGVPVTWVVLNNYGLGWPKYGQKLLGERYIAVDYESQPQFAELAQACECYGERVEHPSQVRAALQRALQENLEGTPAVLDFIVDPWDLPEGFHVFHDLKGHPG
jgi:acetolactate synthase-1/2/3 large subunit